MRRLAGIVTLLLLAGCGSSSSSSSGRTTVMTFSDSTGLEIRNPTDVQIRSALADLNAQGDGESFAILAGDTGYVQVAGDPAAGFIVEYQEGGPDRQYQSKRADYSVEEVAAMMIAYRDGLVQWSEVGEWSKLTW